MLTITLSVIRMVSWQRLIHMLEEQQVDAAMLYTSDHGEDIFDDSRHLFLHASPVPSYYQLHVPFLIWMSDIYRETYPEHWKAMVENKDKNISSSCSFFPTICWNWGEGNLLSQRRILCGQPSLHHEAESI